MSGLITGPMRRTTVKPLYPTPEAIDRGDAIPTEWHIREGHGATEPHLGDMAVPLGESAHEEWVRAHEVAHVKWSPPEGPASVSLRAPKVFVQATEDARINQLMQRIGLADTGYSEEEINAGIHESLTIGDKRRAILLAVAATGTVEGDAFDMGGMAYNVAIQRGISNPGGWSERCAELVDRAREIIGENLDDFASAVNAAEWLYTMLRTEDEAHEDMKSRPRGDGDGNDDDDEGRDSVEGDEGEARETERRHRRETDGGDLRGGGTGRRRWGRMTIVQPPLSKPLPKKRTRLARWRPSDEGSVPRYMARWATDKGVFATRGRGRSGTVLVDGSGSMSLSTEEVERLLEGTPAALVASYAGGDADGELWIVGRRGRRSAEVRPDMRGNVIDGPALRWLGTQKGPRIWVSDGDVTGTGDHVAAHLRRDAMAVCRRYGILRVDTMDEALNILLRRGRR